MTIFELNSPFGLIAFKSEVFLNFSFDQIVTTQAISHLKHPVKTAGRFPEASIGQSDDQE